MRYPEEPPSTRPWARTVRAPQSDSTDTSARPNTDNAVKYDTQLRGCRKIRGTEHGEEHEQSQEPKLNMGDTDDTPSGTNTNTQN